MLVEAEALTVITPILQTAAEVLVLLVVLLNQVEVTMALVMAVQAYL
jgi:hypothetical protein